MVGFGPDSNDRYRTTYFRHSFDIGDVSQIVSLSGRLVRDDGAAVYLNGTEVTRQNLRPGALFNQSASSTTPNQTENEPQPFTVDPSLLVPGTNVLAVEVHQANATSSDLSFDLELTAQTEGAGASEDGARLRIDRRDVLTVNPQNTPRNRFGTINLSAGTHTIDLVFFERAGAAEFELFAAAGAFTAFDQTDDWSLVGDTGTGGLPVVTDPLPPVPIQWQPSEPAGSLSLDFAASEPVPGAAGMWFSTPLRAGQVLSLAATPVDPGAELTLQLRGPAGTVQTAVAPAPGAAVSMAGVSIETDGDYVIGLTSTQASDVTITGELNRLLERELAWPADSNNSAAQAQSLDPGYLDLGGGAARTAVRGRTDGMQRVESQTDNLFAPNALAFEFDDLAGVQGDAVLLVTATGDLDAPDEFLTLNAEGLVTQDLFVTGGLSKRAVQTSVQLSADQIAALAADGSMQFTLTPSPEVTDTGDSRVQMVLRLVPRGAITTACRWRAAMW